MSGPFTQDQLTIIQVAKETSSFLGHHHHSHHHDHGHGHDHHKDEHSQFKIPQKLTTSLGLYALKKINTIKPAFLKESQSRLLEPVTPGPISYLINAGFYVATGVYAAYLWRTRGLRGFASIAVLPLAALFVARPVTNHGISYLRDKYFYIQRRQLVNDYVSKYGQTMLLSALHPNFRI